MLSSQPTDEERPSMKSDVVWIHEDEDHITSSPFINATQAPVSHQEFLNDEDNGTLKQAIQRMKQSLNVIESHLQSSLHSSPPSDQVANLQAQLDSLLQERDQLQEKLSTVQQSEESFRSNATAKFTLLQEQLMRLTAKQETWCLEEHVLREKVTHFEKESEQWKTEKLELTEIVQSMQAENQKWQEKVEQNQEQIQEKETLHQQKDSEIQSLRLEIENLKSQLQEQQQQNVNTESKDQNALLLQNQTLQSQLTELENQFQSTLIERDQRYSEQLEEHLQRQRTEYESRYSALQQDLLSLQQKYQKQQHDHDRMIDQMKIVQSVYVEQLKSEHVKAVQGMKEEFEMQLMEVKQKAVLLQDENKSELVNENALLVEQVSQLKAEREMALENAKVEYSASLEQMQSEHNAAVEQLKHDYNLSLEQLKSENNLSLEQLKSEYNLSLEQLKSDHAIFVEQLKTECNQSIALVKAESDDSMAQWKTEHNATLEQIKEQLQQSQNQLESLVQEKQGLEQHLNHAKDHIQQLEESLSQAQNETESAILQALSQSNNVPKQEEFQLLQAERDVLSESLVEKETLVEELKETLKSKDELLSSVKQSELDLKQAYLNKQREWHESAAKKDQEIVALKEGVVHKEQEWNSKEEALNASFNETLRSMNNKLNHLSKELEQYKNLNEKWNQEKEELKQLKQDFIKKEKEFNLLLEAQSEQLKEHELLQRSMNEMLEQKKDLATLNQRHEKEIQDLKKFLEQAKVREDQHQQDLETMRQVHLQELKALKETKSTSTSTPKQTRFVVELPSPSQEQPLTPIITHQNPLQQQQIRRSAVMTAPVQRSTTLPLAVTPSAPNSASMDRRVTLDTSIQKKARLTPSQSNNGISATLGNASAKNNDTPLIYNENTPSTDTTPLRRKQPICVAFSGFKDAHPVYTNAMRRRIGEGLIRLNVSVHSDADMDANVTHLITPPDSRTLKTYAAALMHKWIVTPEWALACIENGRIVEEHAYGQRYLDSPFQGKRFYVAPSFMGDGSATMQSRLDNCKTLVVTLGKGNLVDREEDAEFVLKSSTDEASYQGKGLDWSQLIQMIPTP